MRWRIEQTGTTWRVLAPDGTAHSADHPSYQAALAAMPGRTFAPVPPVVPPAPADEAAAPDPAEVLPTERSWTADAAFVDAWTGDGRMIDAAGVTFRPTPMPLMLQTETEIGHFGAELAGWIDSCEVTDGRIRMMGMLDSGDEGETLLTILTERGTFGVSVDMGACTVESECVAMDDDGWCSEWRDRFTEAEMIGLTATPFPAFQNARMWLTVNGEPEALPEDPAAVDDRPAITPDDSGAVILLASAASAPVRPPADWFADPAIGALDHPLMTFNAEGCALGAPLQVTDDGRVFGHLAAWGTCHIGLEGCTTPPASPSQYAYFRTGYVVADDGGQVPTGVLTMGTGHADLHLSARDAVSHYDDATFGVADVAAGEDEVGIWIAGALRPETTPEQVRALRALSPSGDWRSIGGNLELVAALAVNVPGFPIPRSLAAAANVTVLADARPAARSTAGVTVAMVASGVVAHRDHADGPLVRRVAALEAIVASLDTRTAPLVASARQAVIARVRG